VESIRRLVVAALLTVWCFPAVSAAKSLPPVAAAQAPATAASNVQATATESDAQATESLAARERQAPDLQNFKGGRAYIYLSSGALLIIIIVLLILLV
jgi:hypothetical protein